jgi:hypothetical protein
VAPTPSLRERAAHRRGWLCLSVALALALAASVSCTVHRHRIGTGPTGVGEESARQYYIFFGALQLNEVNVQRMAAELSGYEIVTETSFVDYLLAPFLGLFTITSRTVTVLR